MWSFAAVPTRYDTVRTAPFNPRIHNMGNVGLGGELHARVAGLATRIIDSIAYDGVVLRSVIASRLREETEAKEILELGCGVGTLTSWLVDFGFNVTAVDTSPQMVAQARRQVPAATVNVANAADTHGVFHGAVACMLFHELPPVAHMDVLRAVSGSPFIWVVDISDDYEPSALMRRGEPYIDSYLKSISSTMFAFSDDNGFVLEREKLVNGRVDLWKLTRSE